MPITSSQITEDSQQADGRRWITELHTDSINREWPINYLAAASTDAVAVMNARVSSVNDRLIDSEIAEYLRKIENGENVIGLTYTETTQKYRALQFLLWAKERIKEKDFDSLQYAYLVTDPYTEAQINILLEGTEFAGKADKVKIWADKLRDMKTAMTDAELAAEDV